MKKRLALLFHLLLAIISTSTAQDVTKVRGQVYDAKTGETIPFATIVFQGTTIGTSTDLDGKYSIDTRFASDSLTCTFLGYQSQTVAISKGDKQDVNFALSDETLKLNTVDIIAKKKKYSKKNNPSLELAKKITKNRELNRLKGQDYYAYDQYEKVRLDLNNITQQFKDRAIFTGFDFLWEYIDTSEVNGKTYLPVFLREIMSTVYYKKEGNKTKEYRHAQRNSNFSDRLDIGSLNSAIDILYNDIDIYESEIPILEQQFVSPLAPAGVDFYRYYIIDTLELKGKEVINLAFIPAVKGNLGFVGNIYVSNDDRYTVSKVDMGIVKDINLNFVRDMRIIQEFVEEQGRFVKTKDEVVIDYALTENSVGAYGTRDVHYDNFRFTEPTDPGIFSPLENVIDNPEGLLQPDTYWETNALYRPTIQDVKAYEMVDRLRNNGRYKTYLALGRAVSSGFIQWGPIDYGPLATLVSFNDVEGLNLRFGGKTNKHFSKKWKLQAYGARAFDTEEWKYSAGLTYSFNDYWGTNPRHFIQLSAERESVFPGQELQYFSPNNFLLSFQRGNATRMLLEESYRARYRRELNGYAYEVGGVRKKRLPYGSLDFSLSDQYEGPDQVSDITTTEGYLAIRYAPNEQFLQGETKRRQLYNEFPIINLRFSHGLAEFGQRSERYSKIHLNMFKQFEWTTMGTTDIIVEGGKTWGNIPYLLQYIPRGNQTYAYQLPSYNMMNFLEFATDQFASIKMEHFFYGYFLNRIPLIRRLKLRELITFKAVYGSLSDANNPDLNPDHIQFAKDADGQPTTFVLGKEPYMEASIGLTNILKFLRVDLVQRLNYLDQPNLPTLFGRKGMGIRATFVVEF